MTSRAPAGLPAGLIALALGGFGIGLTEFVILGLLPQVASDFNVTIPQAGYLVSSYALSVAVGGIFITAATASLRPKTVLCALMILFILGNLLSATSSTYSMMLLGRIVAALCHGAFFGIGSVLAASLVPPARKARAISIMFLGLTVANVLGVPVGTLLGQHYGWRSTFWVITVIGVVAFLGLLLFIPHRAGEIRPPGQFIRELAAFRNGQVWLSILVTVFGFGAMFGTFTYITPILTDLARFSDSSIPWMLVLFGVGLFVGNIVGGRAADARLDRSLLVFLSTLTVVLTIFAITAANPWAAGACLFLLGAVGFASVPGMQMRVIEFARAAPTLASGVNISAFNTGNAIGAYIGGLTITAGLNYRAPIWVGAVLAAIAVGLMITAVRTSRTTTSPAGPSPFLPTRTNQH